MLIFFALLFLSSQSLGFRLEMSPRLMSTLCMSSGSVRREGVAGWLLDRSDDVYTAQILRLARQNAVKGLSEGQPLLEIEFPATRSNDPSVTETLDRTRAFTRDFIKDDFFQKLGRRLWVVFPDANEAFLARSKWGDTLPFVLTSIQGALTDKSSENPEVILCISPGFNIDEWINIEKVADSQPQAKIVTINGNLERLRNGYYPAIFYPGLTASTNRFYKRFKQALFLNPIAVAGDRLGAWLYKDGVSSPWQVLVKQTGAVPRLDSISATEQEPKATDAWRQASAAYKKSAQ